jgi:hypothetical protein
MKTKLVLSMLTLAVVFTACKKESPAPVDTVITATITELDAQAATFIPNPPPAPPTITGDYTKFSFAEGTVVEGDDWGIAFRSTSIIFNGGMASDTSQPNRTGNAAVYIIDLGLKFVRTYLLEVAGKKADIIMSSIIFEKVLDLKIAVIPKPIGSFASVLKEFESIRAFMASSTIAIVIDMPFVFICKYVTSFFSILPCIPTIISFEIPYFKKHY